MDNQQTASNQSSVRVGDEYSTKNIDETIHKGSTWITDSQTGKLYEVNGTFDQTSGSWSGKGTINEYDKNGKFIGSYNGELTGTGNMADYQEYVRKGGHGGMEDAFLAQSVVSRNLDASDKVTDNYVRENKYVDDTSSMINNTTTINTGTNYQGVVQAAMENGSNLEMMVGRLADMKGKVSDEEYKAEVRKFSGAYAQEMGQFLEKSEQESWGTQGQAGVGFDINGNYNSNNSWYGKAAEGATGLSVSASGGFSVGANLSMNNATQEAQNLIAKEMYDTIMQSGNTSDMMNNVSNLANKHVNTNLSDLENLGNKLNDMTEQAKQVGGNIKEVGGNMVNNAKNLLK